MSSLDLYFKWLREKFSEETSGQWTELVTPFLDKNNDHIQMYFRETNGKIVITDAGQTFSNLDMLGFPRTEKRMDVIATIFRGFNVDWSEDQSIEITCEKEKFPEKFHAMLQTILSVDSLGYLSKENVRSMFNEDVAMLLKKNEITFYANQEVKGRSGLTLSFPFFVPSHKHYQSSHLQLVSQSHISPKRYLFEWSDTEEARANSKAITIIDDRNIAPSKKFLNAFTEYGVSPVLWTETDSIINELVS